MGGVATAADEKMRFGDPHREVPAVGEDAETTGESLGEKLELVTALRGGADDGIDLLDRFLLEQRRR